MEVYLNDKVIQQRFLTTIGSVIRDSMACCQRNTYGRYVARLRFARKGRREVPCITVYVEYSAMVLSRVKVFRHVFQNGRLENASRRMRLLFRSGVSARGIIYVADALLHSNFAHTRFAIQWQTRVKPLRLNNRLVTVRKLEIFLHQRHSSWYASTLIIPRGSNRIKRLAVRQRNRLARRLLVVLVVIVVYLFVDESILLFLKKIVR